MVNWQSGCARSRTNYTTPVEFVECLTLHAVVEGVGRANIDWGYKKRIKRPMPLVGEQAGATQFSTPSQRLSMGTSALPSR